MPGTVVTLLGMICAKRGIEPHGMAPHAAQCRFPGALLDPAGGL